MKAYTKVAVLAAVFMLAPTVVLAKPMTSYAHPTKTADEFEADIKLCNDKASAAANAVAKAQNPAGNAAGAFGAGFAEGLAQGRAMNEARTKCFAEGGYVQIELSKDDEKAFKKAKKDDRIQWLKDYFVKRSAELQKPAETPAS